MKRRITSVLLIALLLFSMSTAAFAAGSSVVLSWQKQGSRFRVEASLTAEGATNGRWIIQYDPEVLELVSAEPDGNWIVSVDTQTAGEVAFAWVASDLSSAKTKMLTMVFARVYSGDIHTEIKAEITELYDSEEELPLPADKAVEITVEVPAPVGPAPEEPEEPVTPVTPVEPTPDEPVTPVTPAENPFTDIDGHWAEDEIIAAYQAGLMNGVGNGQFAPNVALNRAMFATVLYRLAGSPAVSGQHPFTDTVSGMYYEDAVLWAWQNGVVTGTSETTFDPDGLLTREQMVTMLYRYAKFSGMDVSNVTPLDSYSDYASVSGFAADAMQWAVAAQIIKGQNNQLMPADTTTRAQAAAVLVRFAG